MIDLKLNVVNLLQLKTFAIFVFKSRVEKVIIAYNALRIFHVKVVELVKRRQRGNFAEQPQVYMFTVLKVEEEK